MLYSSLLNIFIGSQKNKTKHINVKIDKCVLHTTDPHWTRPLIWLQVTLFMLSISTHDGRSYVMHFSKGSCTNWCTNSLQKEISLQDTPVKTMPKHVPAFKSTWTKHANWKEKKQPNTKDGYNFYKYQQVSEPKSQCFEKQQFFEVTLLQIPVDLSSSVRAKSTPP